MDGGQRNLGRTAILGGTIIVAVSLIAAGFMWPKAPEQPQTPENVTIEQPVKSLHVLADEEDLPGLQERIDAGEDLNAPASDSALAGLTPLMIAVRNGSSETTALLLSAGADPNAAGLSGRTALFVGAEQGDADLVELLLEAGADPGVAAAGGRTALMSASASSDPAITILLLNAGADARAKDARGRTALDIASIRNDAAGQAIASLLAEAGSR